jgi:hypothetical protein
MATLIDGKWTTVCGKTRGHNKNGDFSKERAEQHEKTCRFCELGVPYQKSSKETREFSDPILDMADLIAGDESDGVYWGIAYELGYFG